MSLLASDPGPIRFPMDPILAHIRLAINPMVWNMGMPGKATQEIVLGVITQKLGDIYWLVVYFSIQLDSVANRWPSCRKQ